MLAEIADKMPPIGDMWLFAVLLSIPFVVVALVPVALTATVLGAKSRRQTAAGARGFMGSTAAPGGRNPPATYEGALGTTHQPPLTIHQSPTHHSKSLTMYACRTPVALELNSSVLPSGERMGWAWFEASVLNVTPELRM